jgi:periplasmic protein TonB
MRRFNFFAAVFALFVASPSAQEVFKPGNGVSVPTVVRQVRPDYTEAAKAARIEGDVILQAVVLADGMVGEVTVTDSLDSANGLDEQAVKAMKQWQFKPGEKDSQPVAVQIAVQMRFTLK